MDKKQGFYLFTDIYTPLKRYSDQEAGQAFKAILTYVVEGEIDETAYSDKALVMYDMLKGQIDRTNKAFETKREANRQNGVLGGRPPKAVISFVSIYNEITKGVYEKVSDKKRNMLKDDILKAIEHLDSEDISVTDYFKLCIEDTYLKTNNAQFEFMITRGQISKVLHNNSEKRTLQKLAAETSKDSTIQTLISMHDEKTSSSLLIRLHEIINICRNNDISDEIIINYCSKFDSLQNAIQALGYDIPLLKSSTIAEIYIKFMTWFIHDHKKRFASIFNFASDSEIKEAFSKVQNYDDIEIALSALESLDRYDIRNL